MPIFKSSRPNQQEAMWVQVLAMQQVAVNTHSCRLLIWIAGHMQRVIPHISSQRPTSSKQQGMALPEGQDGDGMGEERGKLGGGGGGGGWGGGGGGGHLGIQREPQIQQGAEAGW